MGNNKHAEYERKNEKWRKASNKATDLKYALEDVLASFTEEEKSSNRYRQFIETVSQHFDHSLGDINKKKQEESAQAYHKVKKNNGWMSYKSAIIAVIGAVVIKLIEIIPQLITALSASGGTP